MELFYGGPGARCSRDEFRGITGKYCALVRHGSCWLLSRPNRFIPSFYNRQFLTTAKVRGAVKLLLFQGRAVEVKSVVVRRDHPSSIKKTQAKISITIKIALITLSYMQNDTCHCDEAPRRTVGRIICLPISPIQLSFSADELATK